MISTVGIIFQGPLFGWPRRTDCWPTTPWSKYFFATTKTRSINVNFGCVQYPYQNTKTDLQNKPSISLNLKMGMFL